MNGPHHHGSEPQPLFRRVMDSDSRLRLPTGGYQYLARYQRNGTESRQPGGLFASTEFTAP